MEDKIPELAECICRDNCVGIFPMSKCAYNVEKNFIREYAGSDILEEMINKMEVMHPPQPVIISDKEYIEKVNRDLREISFLFIASRFFVKGGREIVKALKHFEGKYPFHLKIIGGIETGDYFVNQSQQETDEYRHIVKETPWIQFTGRIPNELVLKACVEADVGLLPSFTDTYGYSVLEMQAGGTPVITSNIRAFPEINHSDCGYICNLPVNSSGFCKGTDMNELSQILEDELVLQFEEIFAHPEKIKEKRKASIERIQKMHDPIKYAERLWGIYNR